LLCDLGPRVLAAFPEPLSRYAADALAALGVEVRLGQSVTAMDSAALIIGEERIEAGGILWCAGTVARPAARWLDTEAARNGAVKVRDNCSVPGHPEIFAIGDVASHANGSGKPLPGLAPVAKQQGRYVAAVLKARLAGRADLAPFRYRDFGTIAVIGRSRAVADFGWIRLTGFLAWLTWSLVHLLLLVDLRSRLTVYLNWTWAWFTYGRGARLLTRDGLERSEAGAQASRDRGVGGYKGSISSGS
jgi:NADH dehydrogenase